MHTKSPKQHANVIRLMLPGDGKQRAATHQRHTAIVAVKNFSRIQEMIKRSGCWMFTRTEYIGHRYSQGCKPKAAAIEWASKIEDPMEHTQYDESQELILAVKKPHEVIFDDKLVAKKKKATQSDMRAIGSFGASGGKKFRDVGGTIINKARGSSSRMATIVDESSNDDEDGIPL